MSNANTKNAQVIFPQKGAVIIDGGFLEPLKKEFGIDDLDIIKLCEFLCEPAYRVRSYYFDGKDDARQGLHNQLDMLDRFDVILGDVVKREEVCTNCKQKFPITQQKRVDVLLAVKMVHLASTNQVDLIVLLAGDRDFVPVVDVAKSAGVIIRLVYGKTGNTQVAPSLHAAADERIHLTKEIMEKFSNKSSKKQVKKEKKKKKSIPETKDNNEQLKIIEEKNTKITDHIVSCIEELIKEQGEETIKMSDLGTLVKQKNTEHPKKLTKFIEKHSKDKIKVIRKNGIINVSLTNKNTIQKLTKEVTSDKGIKFLLKTINEILKETKENTTTKNSLANRMYQKNSSWKKDFGLSKNKAITKLLLKAENLLTINKTKTDWIIGIKK